MEAVLLAGGLGTRLHAVTGDKYPKCLAVVNNKPFIHYLIDYLMGAGVKRFVFALSHHSKMVINELQKAYPMLDVVFSIEEEPLGTGGAIKQALSFCKNTKALVLNADSFVEADINKFIKQAEDSNCTLSMICTSVDDISRFGAAKIENNRLVGFFEKGQTGAGYINAGIYYIDCNHKALADLQANKFSFEKEVLENHTYAKHVFTTQGLFFDIGTPDDFQGAQQLVKINDAIFGKNAT